MAFRLPCVFRLGLRQGSLLRPQPVFRHSQPCFRQVRTQYGTGGRPRYQRFDGRPTRGNLLYRWSQRPTFYYEVGGIGVVIGGVYISNLETVPVSGRRRFNIVGNDLEMQMAQQQYQQILQEFGNRILPSWDKRTRMVQRVLNRLIPASGLTDAKWEVYVIDDNQMNAFVIPGGKVFVFSGMLPICGGEDGLATVLGHEIAHNLAHHAAERMSAVSVMLIALQFLRLFDLPIPDGATQLLLDFGFLKPGSRKQESEADYIGLMMMAQSCYNPDAAVGLWGRMAAAEKHAPPQFLSTHPGSSQRQHAIQEWLPEAHQKRETSDCSSVLDYADDFRRTYEQFRW